MIPRTITGAGFDVEVGPYLKHTKYVKFYQQSKPKLDTLINELIINDSIMLEKERS